MSKSSMQPPDGGPDPAPAGLAEHPAETGDRVARQAPSDGVDLADAAGWLRLALTPGIGPAATRALLGAFGLPEAMLGRPHSALAAVIGAASARALLSEDAGRDRAVAATMAWLGGGPARHLVTLADARYPPRLLETADPPALLYVLGDPAVLSRPAVAIVGSRDATAGGLDNAAAFACALADTGLAVFSGLAAGIDGAAHRGALGRRGGTAAFVGTGADRVYPARHRDLAHAIVEQGGAIASELPLGTPPLPAHFPRRNRLIAGAALGVLVVEAARDSGSLITARLAAELGREVFALPGSIHAPLARGCHDLIRQGARLVEELADILSELPAEALPPAQETAVRIAPPRGSGPPPEPALDALGWDPVAVDALVARTDEPAAAWTARLVGWELDGLASRLPDGRWQRRH